MPPIPEEERYYLQGPEPALTYGGERWIRSASLNPEAIHSVDYFKDDRLIYTSFDSPFSVNFESNWRQRGVESGRHHWKALIRLANGDVLERSADTDS